MEEAIGMCVCECILYIHMHACEHRLSPTQKHITACDTTSVDSFA